MQDPDVHVENPNGTGVTSSELAALMESTRPVVKRIFEWVEVAPDEYPGFKVLLWRNHPQTLVADMQTGMPDKFYPAIRRAMKEHSGFLMEREIDVLAMQPVVDDNGTKQLDERGDVVMAMLPVLDDYGEPTTEIKVMAAPPAQDTRAFFDFIPQDLANAITYIFARMAQQLPNSTKRLNQA